MIVTLVLCGLNCLAAGELFAQERLGIYRPEERTLSITQRQRLNPVPIPELQTPPVPRRPLRELPPRDISLDEAIQIALTHAEAVRVLTGVTASASGRTIYDVPSTQTTIDQAQAAFDPTLALNQSVNQIDSPNIFNDPLNPGFATVFGSQAESYSVDFTLSKLNAWGGTTEFGVNSNPTYTEFGLVRPLLNPNDRSNVELSLRQPLLRGAGRAANAAPIVVARLNTERSFFQYKDSVQELVRGVVEAYWQLVFARTDLWARQKQVEQARFAVELIRGRRAAEFGLENLADQAQAEVAFYNFQAALLNAQSNVLQREEALRNILGLPPIDGTRLVPVTPPRRDFVTPQWNELLRLAEQNRPDIIELKLVLEADQQNLIQARNQTQPQLDAFATYRWNGLEGTLVNGSRFETAPGQFTDWTLGVNFSVPFGLRQSRAGLRQQELVLARDRVNLEQGVHQMVHQLSLNYRNLDLFYAQFELFQRTRDSARSNLEAQFNRYRAGLVILLNVLQAITDWGNAVSSEAQSLTQYNTQLATLERETGTILESHGIRFYEERFGFAGPLGCDLFYPAHLRPADNEARYGFGEQPAEESFDLSNPVQLPELRLEKPQPPPLVPLDSPQNPLRSPPSSRFLPDHESHRRQHASR